MPNANMTVNAKMTERDWEDLRRAVVERRADFENGNTRSSRSAQEQRRFDSAVDTIERLTPCAMKHDEARYSRLRAEVNAEWE